MEYKKMKIEFDVEKDDDSCQMCPAHRPYRGQTGGIFWYCNALYMRYRGYADGEFAHPSHFMTSSARLHDCPATEVTTCTMKDVSEKTAICSCCDWSVDKWTIDDSQFCPHCGARILHRTKLEDKYNGT